MLLQLDATRHDDNEGWWTRLLFKYTNALFHGHPLNFHTNFIESKQPLRSFLFCKELIVKRRWFLGRRICRLYKSHLVAITTNTRQRSFPYCSGFTCASLFAVALWRDHWIPAPDPPMGSHTPSTQHRGTRRSPPARSCSACQCWPAARSASRPTSWTPTGDES